MHADPQYDTALQRVQEKSSMATTTQVIVEGAHLSLLPLLKSSRVDPLTQKQTQCPVILYVQQHRPRPRPGQTHQGLLNSLCCFLSHKSKQQHKLELPTLLGNNAMTEQCAPSYMVDLECMQHFRIGLGIGLPSTQKAEKVPAAAIVQIQFCCSLQPFAAAAA